MEVLEATEAKCYNALKTFFALCNFDFVSKLWDILDTSFDCFSHLLLVREIGHVMLHLISKLLRRNMIKFCIATLLILAIVEAQPPKRPDGPKGPKPHKGNIEKSNNIR